MMYSVLFSIPVHEKTSVVLDQIANYKFFNPEAAIVLHLSRNFVDDDVISLDKLYKIIEQLEYVYINPEHVRTGYYDIIQAHLSNFRFALDLGIEFHYFCLSASNEMFIKSGLYSFIINYKAGFTSSILNPAKEKSITYRAYEDDCLKKIIKSLDGNISNIINSQVEGAFFEKKLFCTIYEVINRYFDYKKVHKLYPREEVYFQTCASLLCNKGEIYNDNYTYFNKKSPIIAVHKIDVDNCLNDYIFKYSVKRIVREVNNPMRLYIRLYIGKYKNILDSYGIKTKEVNIKQIQAYDVCLQKCENKMKIKSNFIKLIRSFKTGRYLIDRNKFLI